MKTTANSKITNVRVIYNDGRDFVDYPNPTNALNNTTKWKIISQPNVKLLASARKLAEQTYNQEYKSPLLVKVNPILESNVEMMMNQSGRYGYIADPYRAMQGFNDYRLTGSVQIPAHKWTRLGTGGCLFPGQCNGLDGNLGTTSVTNRYGRSDEVVSQTPGGNSVRDWDDDYYWYGSNSLAYAVQVVHIPNSVPLVSNGSGHDMRVFITIASGTTIDNAKFRVHIADYDFDGTGASAGVSYTTTSSFTNTTSY